MPEKILLIEDDREISDMLRNFLMTENFEVITAYDGESACEKFFADQYSLVLLDLMIPKVSGMEVMKAIRENNTVPIIILSAKDTDSDKTLGLGLGADDYITKPFSVTEVLARIKANIRRNTKYAVAAGENTILTKGNITVNPDDYSVMKNGENIDLTAKEFEILKLLMQNPKKVYTKEQIYSSVWNDAYFGDENAVNVHISRLRSKIEDDPHDPQYIVTVWGIGYKLGDGNE
ncbi:MAG: response regulator transcription factor [Lachnospiraceae bacterium]|nr:response regulator transcription factor [Lachnospiraceae bacterium]